MSVSGRRILTGLFAALLTAGAAWASAPARSPTPAPADAGPAASTSTVEGITVISPKVEQEKLPAMVEHFVQAHSATSRIDQLSRWGGSVCPQTGGLPPAFNAYVSARVKAVAANIGAPVDKRPNRNFPCRPNLLIAFTTDPQKLMDDVRRRHPQMLGFHYAAQAERMARVEHPIQAWYMTGTKAQDGLLEPDDEFHRMPTGSAGSRLSVRLESQFVAVLVIVDSNKILGHQIGAISDDVAMLSLSHAGTDPPGLSAYDIAYLKALYSTNPELFAHAQQSEIGSRILREVQAPPAGAAPTP
jgi:hypothetical protein